MSSSPDLAARNDDHLVEQSASLQLWTSIADGRSQAIGRNVALTCRASQLPASRYLVSIVQQSVSVSAPSPARLRSTVGSLFAEVRPNYLPIAGS